MALISKIRKNLAIYVPTIQTWLLSGLHWGEIETIASHVADRTGRNPSHPLVTFARALAEKTIAVPNRFTENGEKALLERLSAVPVRVLFDVGANVGTWSRHSIKVFPHAELHAFEILPTTFEELRRRLPDEPRLHLNKFGLSDYAGNVMVYTYPSNLVSSIFTLESETTSGRVDCIVQRGADYAAAHDIRRIDILKIDVEGAEGKVIAGFEPMISEHRIRLIQFEYNRGSILGNFLLKNAYEFFTTRGYRVGKLMPDGVHFHKYSFAHEDFVGPNYIACCDDDSELLHLIT